MRTTIAALLAFSTLSVPLALASAAFATSYPPARQAEEVESETSIVNTGTIAYLFHSGTEEVRRTVVIDDVLTVYRPGRAGELHPVGKVKVLSEACDNYYKVLVVEGEIKLHDIARKETVSCLATLQARCPARE